MSLQHHFNTFLAGKYGLQESIFVDSFVFWTRTNVANNKNYHDGRYWSYGTPKFFHKYFPYLTERRIKTILANCINKNILVKGNFNKKGYDKTSWYSLSDQVLSDLNLNKQCLQVNASLTVQKTAMDRTKNGDGLDKKRRPIPDTKPDTKPDTIFKEKNKKDFENDELSIYDAQPPTPTKEHKKPIDIILKNNIFDLPEQAVLDYQVNRKAKRAPITPTVIKNLYRELNKCVDAGYDTTQCFEIMVASGWSTLRLDWIKNVMSGNGGSKHDGITAQTSGWLANAFKKED